MRTWDHLCLAVWRQIFYTFLDALLEKTCYQDDILWRIMSAILSNVLTTMPNSNNPNIEETAFP